MRFTNNKLSYKIIERIMKPTIEFKDQYGNISEIANVTATEIDLLLYMSLRQDAFGNVKGIYYKDACAELNCCKQSFYNALYGLESKDYIQINYSHENNYWECTILYNMFLNTDDDHKGYFNTNREFLFSNEFKKLKSNEKKLCIKLAISYKSLTGLKIYPENLANSLGIKSLSLIFNYLENIKNIFPYSRKPGLKRDKICFAPGNTYPEKNKSRSEKENFLIHKIRYFCSIYKVNYTLKDLMDLIILIGQYGAIGIGKLFSCICKVLLEKKSIEPAYINYILNNSDILAT